MRRGSLLATVVVLIGALSACDEGITIRVGNDVDGSGTITSESRAVADFERVTLAGEGTVIITQEPAASLTIETDDNLLAHIETTVRDGTLTIATESGIDIDPSDGVIYQVGTPELSGVSLSGAGSFELGECEADRFSVTLSGAGDIDIGRLIADELDVEITGAGDVRVVGEVTHQDISIPGSGSFDGFDLQSATAAVATSGVGSATVWVTDVLDATVSGVGSIDYYGSPQVSQSVSGVGDVVDRGERS